MANTETNSTALDAFDDSMIPDGYSADDLLEGLETEEKTAPEETGEEEAEEVTDPTSEGENKADDSADGGNEEPEGEEKPEDTPAEPRKLKFKAKINHEEVDAEIGEDELPALYQKAQNHDRMQKRVSDAEASNKEWENIAKLLGYDSADAMRKSVPENYKRSEIKKLIDQGVNDDVAAEVVESRMARNFGSAKEEKETSDSSDEQKSGRDFSDELKILVQLHPEMNGKQLPQTVVEDAVHNSKHVAVAYQDWLNKQNAAELQKTKKENNVLKQNAAATAKAPVKGASGGEISRLSKTEQALLRGFDYNG